MDEFPHLPPIEISKFRKKQEYSRTAEKERWEQKQPVAQIVEIHHETRDTEDEKRGGNEQVEVYID